jgi:CheY-like chemotaxis protein
MDNPFTMIIMDLSMPVMDGYDSSRAIMDYCTNNKMKTIPTIYAVTANERTPELEEKIKSYGMHSTQPKPLPFPILKQLL